MATTKKKTTKKTTKTTKEINPNALMALADRDRVFIFRTEDEKNVVRDIAQQCSDLNTFTDDKTVNDYILDNFDRYVMRSTEKFICIETSVDLCVDATRVG